MSPTKNYFYVVIPHFEADECGALNDLLALAPQAEPVASIRCALASLVDFAAVD